MKLKHLYLLLCVLGAVLPYSQFVPWVAQHGLNLPLMVRELLVNRISTFFGLDVILSAVTLIVFISIERRRSAVPKWWLAVLGTAFVGVSLGLPLFLLLRELAMENHQNLRGLAASP